MKNFISRFLIVILMTLLIFCLNIVEGQQTNPVLNKADKMISLPGGEAGIGFDDLQFSSSLDKVLIPGGRTGKLCLIGSKDQSLNVISGFSEKAGYSSGHGDGITSVNEGDGVLYVTDRSALRLNVLDIASKSIIARADLAGGPDYVRYVAPTNEVWVTEPEKDRIEVFTLPANKKMAPVHSEFIAVPGGPEALVVDKTRGKAYTHLWKKETVTIDLKSHKILSTWPNGCEGSRGIALNETKGYLFVGCAEGKAVVLDLTQNGKQISSISSGSGVDIIAYNSSLSHLYLPGGKSATMAILGVSESGELSLLGTVATAQGSHCVTTDSKGNAYVCDPNKGQILMFQDRYPAPTK
jgi:DNA-binding beta-propeller fold protein YncE